MTPVEIIDKSYYEAVSPTEYASLDLEDLQSINAMLQNEVAAKSIQIKKNTYLRRNRVTDEAQATRLIDLQRAARKIVIGNLQTIASIIKQERTRTWQQQCTPSQIQRTNHASH